MKFKFAHFIICGLVMVTFGYCKTNSKPTNETSSLAVDSLLMTRYEKLLAYPLDSMAFPRSGNDETGVIKRVPSKDWTSGFFAGNLWQIERLTGNGAYAKRAAKWTAFIEKEKINNHTHDMGFKINCSFGNGILYQDNDGYKKVIVKSAKTLITRFNKNVGSIRSWDFNKDIWEFPVIIDNMMNLELLFEATRISGDSIYYDIAVKHANTTLKHHFRENGSTVHVVVYDTINGHVKEQVTHQGINDASSWARGQGWAIYGYTMAYRYTKDKRYLDRARRTADWFLGLGRLREDGIPYWDFDDPKIPDAPRDVSAGTVVASALVELYGYTNNQSYLDYSKKVARSLKTEAYIITNGSDIPFILKHSTGNWPKHDEVDESINYGDYYFLELLLRLESLNK